jgi:hypothetical protein
MHASPSRESRAYWVFGAMAFATPGGRPSPASMLRGPAAGCGLSFTGYVPYQPTCAGQVAPASRMVAPNQVDNSGLDAYSCGQMPGAMPNAMSREAAAPSAAAPPSRSFLRSMFARCVGEEQEQQTAAAEDAYSCGQQAATAGDSQEVASVVVRLSLDRLGCRQSVRSRRMQCSGCACRRR